MPVAKPLLWEGDRMNAAINRMGFLAVLIFFAGILAGILIQWSVG